MFRCPIAFSLICPNIFPAMNTVLEEKVIFCLLKSVACNRLPALFFMKFYDSDLIYLRLGIFFIL